MRLLRLELTKLFAQRRSYVGWAGLLLVPLLMALAIYLNRHNPHRDNGPGGLIQLASKDGLLMPVAAITLLSGFLLPLLASMVGSYQLAGEAETGTLKTWLMHSISRGGVILSKWGVAIIYIAVGLVLVAAGALVAGALAFGVHAPTLLTGQTVSVPHALWLTALSYLYVLAGVICVLSLALLFATFTNSSLTAAIGALVVVIVMNILGAFSYFDFLKPYLFTSRVDAWQNLFSQPVEWSPILKGVLVFAIYIVALLVAAWYVFRRKDILV
jgi:ABC-2 type transport system permease protein